MTYRVGDKDYFIPWLLFRCVEGAIRSPELIVEGFSRSIQQDIERLRLEKNPHLLVPLCKKSAGDNDEMWEVWYYRALSEIRVTFYTKDNRHQEHWETRGEVITHG